MSQWGQNDQSVTANSTTVAESSRGAPIGTYALVHGGTGQPFGPNSHFGNTSPGSRASVDQAMFGNTTVGAFVNNMAVGVFSVNATMMGTSGGGIILGKVTYPGSGYAANAAVTLTAINGGSGATANTTVATGHVTTLTANQAGTGYGTAPTVAIAAPASISQYANSLGVNTAASALLITTANSLFTAGDRFQYTVPTGNTAIPGLTGNTSYFVGFVNTSAMTVAATSGGANLVISANGSTTETHGVQGFTATGYFDVAAVYPEVTHAGWVVRREGTGGRTGRVFYETLIAGGTQGVNGTIGSGVYGTANVIASNTAVDANL